MKIKVTKDTVKIDKEELYHAGEYNIHDCTFEFSEDYTENLVKKALFGVDGKFYEMSIINNKCDIPYDVLKSTDMVTLGVYAYEIIEQELKLRYSPMYDKFFVNLGSYQEQVENQEEVTPTQYEQYMQALQNGLNDIQNAIDDLNQRADDGEFDGQPGKDGFSPIVTTTPIENGTRVDITDAEGVKSFELSNGEQGKDGITPNLQIGTVTTLEPNEQATVTRTGTDEEPIFNFGIPKGQQGEKGIQGIPGADGQPGQDGADGKDATINGQNTVEITTDNNITLEQQENILKFGLDSQLIPKNDIEGTDNTFDDGLKSPLYGLAGDGKSEQVTTNGNQLIDFYNPTSKSSYVSYSFENDILVVSNTEGYYQKVTFALGDLIKNNQGKKICFTYDNFLYEGDTITNLVIVDDSGTHYNTLITSLGNKIEYTIPEDTSNIISSRIEINSNNDSTPQLGKITITKPLIYFGELNNPPVYEQYSNGIPSPSPDYPQPINSIEGSVEFACRGKNLYELRDYDGTVIGMNLKIENQILTLDGTSNNTWFSIGNINNQNNIPRLKKDEDYTVTFISTFNKDLNCTLWNDVGDVIIQGVKCNPVKANSKSSFTFKCSYDEILTNFRIAFAGFTVGEEVQGTMQIMIERGSQATPYEPYIEPNQVTFNLNDEKLRSVGDVKDELVVDLDTGDYYKVENIGEYVFDGSDDENWSNVPDGTGKERYTSPIIQNLVYTGTKLCQSNYFKSSTSENYYEDGTIRIASSGGVSIYDDLFTSVGNCKQWLSTHNTIVNYILKKPTTKKLGTLSSEDLAKLKTFYGYNNVTINTNLGLMNIRFTYGLDIKKYVDNKIAEISSALIEEG